jgi:hypothetical protein
MVALDGATGRPRWAGHGTGSLLDAGESTQPPRLLSESGDTAICRTALLTTPDGSFQPARGTPIGPALSPDDPRWIRTLPWNQMTLASQVQLVVVIGGLALINVVIPVVILRMATRRRLWSLRLLLALPVAVAIPTAMLIKVKPLSPEVALASWPDAILAMTVVSIAGLPLLGYAGIVGLSILRQRWRQLAWLAGLTALASVAVGAGWLGFDMQDMPAIERYNWSGWYGVALPSAYAVGVLASIAWAVRGAARLVLGLRRRLLAAGRQRSAS